MMLAQIPQPIVNYAPIVVFTLEWTLLCAIVYYGVRSASKESKSQNRQSSLRMSILVLAIWLIPIGVLSLPEFLVFRSVNPISLIVFAQFIVILLDIRRRYQNT